MKRITTISLALFGLALVQCNAFAWGAAGHQVIAAEAYRQLSPEFKAQAFEVLKSHPDFAKWTNAYHPNASFDLPAYVFMRSSTWPDEIRRKGNQYDHPNWHFIDYPLRSPAFPFEPGPKPDDDVLFGVAQCEKTLSDTNANPELRAASLSWLIHLIGDMHQPLHCASLFTAVYPKGDKGGNDFFVRPAQAGVRLHGVWDGLLGSSVNQQIQWNYAIELGTKYPMKSLPELTNDTTPKAWSLESRGLAITKGYLNGDLKGSTNAGAAPSLPDGYTKTAKAVAERQGALAGYRLADDIQKFLKLGKVVPLLPKNTNVVAEAATKKIGPTEANKYYDQTMVVMGKVVQVTVRPTITFLNLDHPSSTSDFTAVIFQENSSKFGNLQKFKDQNVEITGTIVEYRNKPEIILESPDQIKAMNVNVKP